MRIVEYTVADHWASAIVNSDYSGLMTEESAQLSRWLKDHAEGVGHWDGFGENDSQGFTTCEISGLRAHCSTLRRVILDGAP